ncbi:hypothetical protein BSKO_12048 [Bryopsis sp. KO-2023]|nr:hypothetical protein BSKO_12048 [Bryopsis sp. KO-2023]
MFSGKVFREVLKSYSYVVLWMSVSISVILFNKWLLAYSGFPFPLALTMWHMLFCSMVAVVCIKVLNICPTHNMSSQDYFRRVVPIGFLYAGSLWLSNSSYLYLSVSFIQMTKSLMPGLVFGAGVLLGTERFSWAVTGNMTLIAAGVVVCAIGEANLVVKGLVQQLLALVFEATRLTMIQVLINSKGLKMNPLQSLYYVSPACFVGLLIPFSLVEFDQLTTRTDWEFSPLVFIANASAAFFLNLAVFLLIGKTSALTMNIAGVVKDWLLIFFSYSVFKAPVTFLNLFGYVFCCSGVAVYNYMKLQMIKKAAAGEGKHDGDPPLSKNDEEREVLLGDKINMEDRPKHELVEELKRLQGEMQRIEQPGYGGNNKIDS